MDASILSLSRCFTPPTSTTPSPSALLSKTASTFSLRSPPLWRRRRRLRVDSSAAAQKTEQQSTTAGGGKHGELPPEFDDEEWQARQREKTKEWHAYRKKEEDEEKKKTNEYREIGMRLKEYPEEDVREARKLVSSFIRAAEEVEAKIEEAAEKGELTELVLMVIWNRLDIARHDLAGEEAVIEECHHQKLDGGSKKLDGGSPETEPAEDEKDVIRSLDLLYRRVEAEILKREATPSMRLLNDLLNLHDGFDDEGWLKKCRKSMIDTFPQEDPFSMLVPAGFDINNGHFELPEDDDLLLRADFVREVDALLQEVRAEQGNLQAPEGLDPESVATRLKQQEKQRTIHQVEALLELAISLQW